MQLAQEGKLNLDEDVNVYLDDVEVPDTYPEEPVTLHHLLTHTAGFEDASPARKRATPPTWISGAPLRRYARAGEAARRGHGLFQLRDSPGRPRGGRSG